MSFWCDLTIFLNVCFTCCRRLGERFDGPFGFRRHYRSWQQPLHASRKSSTGAFTIARFGNHIWEILWGDGQQRTTDQQETTKTTNRFYSRSVGLSRKEVPLSEISQCSGPQRRRGRFIALRDPSKNLVSKQKVDKNLPYDKEVRLEGAFCATAISLQDEVETAESITIRAVASSSYR